MPNFGQDWDKLGPVFQALVDGLPSDRVAAVVADQIRNALRARAVGLWRVNHSRAELDLVAERGFGEKTADKLRQVPASAALPTARAVATGQVVAIPDTRADASALGQLGRIATREGWGSIIALPLFSRGQPIGAINIATDGRHQHTASERALIRALGDLWVVSLVRDCEAAAVNAELREVNERLVISNLKNQKLAEEAEAARDQVRRALGLREEFMAAAAHELRTPVTVIKGRTQMLLRRDASEAERRQTLKLILQQTNRIADLIDDLLTVIRIRLGLPPLDCERFDLGDLARKQVERITRTTEQHRFQIDVAGPLVVNADRELIGEALHHLLENALSYSRGDGTVEVVARRKGEQAMVSVVDHGPGIAPERQPHLFEPLYEPIPSGKPGYQGMISLGLYLSKEIVELHDGQIWFTSMPDHGSTFSFSLPLA